MRKSPRAKVLGVAHLPNPALPPSPVGEGSGPKAALTQGPWASWPPGWAGTGEGVSSLQTGVIRPSRALILTPVCLKIPCGENPSDVGSSGSSLYLRGHVVASKNHSQRVEWGTEKIENSSCGSDCSQTPLAGSGDKAGRGTLGLFSHHAPPL